MDFKSVKVRRGEGGADSAVGWKGVCIDTKAGFSASCKIYESLQPHDDKMRVVMQGWLEKCGQLFKTWKRWFFLQRKDGMLSY